MASPRKVRLQALVLGRTKLAEQDLILTLLASTGEQLRVVAKGARKPGSRLAARTELFCEVDLLITCGRGLPIVAEAQLLEAHTGLRGDLSRISCAAAMAEVARHVAVEDVGDPYLYPCLARALRAAEEAPSRAHLDLAWAAYALKTLAHAGWRPVLDACVLCGEPARDRLSPEAGGVVCASCATGVAGAVPVAEATLRWLSALISCTFDELMAADIDRVGASVLAEHVGEWARWHLESRLKAAEFLASV